MLVLAAQLYRHPVFDVELPKWWRYHAQMPPGVLLFLPAILIAMLLPQRWLRPYLLATSVLLLYLTFGLGFAAGILAAAVLGWFMCLAARAANQVGPKQARTVLIGGWLLANTIYFSMFLLPVHRMLAEATTLDVLLFCGPTFMLARVLHLFTDLCHGRQVGPLTWDRFALFLLFAPTFRLGPVTRYDQINAELDHSRSQMGWRTGLWGLFRVGFGLLQFLAITLWIDEWLIDRYHERTFFFPRAFFANAEKLSPSEALAGMYLMALRLLLGFEGYSHVALGLCLLIGVRLPENFLWPYVVSNPQTLWRRWHISLGAWLRDYVYIPLGGQQRRGLATLAAFGYCLALHQPTLNMFAFAGLHTGGLLVYHRWRRWAEAAAHGQSPLYRAAQAAGLTAAPVAATLGFLVTIHFWCLSCLVLFDPRGLGLGVMRRIVDGLLQ